MPYSPETLHKFVVDDQDYYLLFGLRELRVYGERGYGLVKLPLISWDFQSFGEKPEKLILDHIKTHLLPN